MHRVALVTSFAALVVTCAACGRAPERGAPADSSSTAAPADTVMPEIRPVSLEQLRTVVHAPGAQVVVVNLWATWCIPCREEFPDLMRLHANYQSRGLRLVLVSADFDDQLPEARRFLARHGVDFVTYLKTGDDMTFIESLNPRWSGALPATFVYDDTGRQQRFWEGKATYDTMERHVLDVLAASGNGRDSGSAAR